MKSPSLDSLYSQIDRHILLAQSYTEISELFFIIKACRLKPYSYVFEEKSEKLILYRQWFDEFGNSFNIDRNKRVKIVYNDLSLPRKSIVCTDLYYGLSLDRVAKMSKFCYLSFGKDEDWQQDCALITFLGIDNYLRSFMYLHGEWQQVSPLNLGMKHLKILSKNKDIKYFLKLDIKENSAIPCIISEQWLSFLPPHKEFLSRLNVQCNPVYSIFQQKER